MKLKDNFQGKRSDEKYMLHCTVLYCTVLNSTVPHCTALYCPTKIYIVILHETKVEPIMVKHSCIS